MGKCNCGTWNSDTAKFCRNCGTKLTYVAPKVYEHKETKTVKTNTNTTPKRTSDTEKVIGTIFFIGLFIVLCICTSGIATPLIVALVLGLRQLWKS